MENYGIKTEAELVTGCILDMKNKLAEREEDSGSQFTTALTTEHLVKELFSEHRKRFFAVTETR